MKKFLLSFLSAIAVWSTAWADVVPYTQSFDSQADFNTLTLYHAGTDTRDWDWSSSAARFYPQRSYNSYDAWFFLPELTLEAGKDYAITFNTRISSSGSSNYKDLSVNIGSEATPEGQTELWRENIQKNSYYAKKVIFSVTTAGVYRIGFRTNAESGSMNDILVDDIKVDVYKELPGAITDASATPGEKGALEVTLRWTNPTLSSDGKQLNSISGVKIYRTNSSWASISDNILIATLTDGIATGESGTWTDTTIPEADTYYYYIVPFNENGDSPTTATSIKSGYVGTDSGLSATKDVVATAVEGNEKAVSLTWAAPSGTNGGYVDPSDISWKITRKGTATTVLEEAWKGELPYNYVDNTIPGLDSYTYTVQYVTDGKTETGGGTSNAVVTGGTAALPYSQNFSTTNSLDLFTNFAGEASSTGTKWNKPSGYNHVQVAQTSGTYDAWLVTPAFEFKAGTYYDLSFDVSAASKSTKAFEVMLGQGTTAADLTTSLFDESLEVTATAATKSIRIKADADGRFHIGFHLKGAASSGYFRLTGISLSEVIIAPEAISDFTVTADENDALKAELAWTNPMKDVVGNELITITKIEVRRGNETIKTYTDATPGAKMTLPDEVEAPGTYSYSVTAYLGENASEAASAQCKVGGAMGLPYSADFTLASTADEWTLPANSSGKAWAYNSTKQCLESPDTKDLWLFTPEFKAKKGTVTLSLTGAIRSSSYKETIKVALYKEADANAQAQCEQVSHTFTSTSESNATFDLEVPENGVYTIGISRPTSGWNLYLYAATIEQTYAISETAPSSVTDLKVTAAADDEKKVIVSWVNPTTTQTGADLASITKIEVLRDNTPVTTLTENLIPGEAGSFIDTIEEPGKYTYTVTVYAGEESSDPASVLSPFLGGAFDLPYEVEITSAETVENWTLPENANGKTWKFEKSSSTYRTGLVGSSNDITAFSVPFNAQKGTVIVSLDAYSYNYNNRETLKVGLYSSAETSAAPIGEQQALEITATSFTDIKTATFDVPENGKYYVGIYLETSRMFCYLHSVKIEQTSVVMEDITVLWNNTDAQFGKPTVEVDGTDYVMTSYGDIALMAEGESSPILNTNVYYATIPGGAERITFKDTADEAVTETYTFEEPKNFWIYNPEGGKEFDENDVTGIEDVECDNETPTRYFDLNGAEVTNPRSGNIYIVLKGDKATKRLIK